MPHGRRIREERSREGRAEEDKDSDERKAEQGRPRERKLGGDSLWGGKAGGGLGLSLDFQKTSCPRRDVVRVACENLQCGMRPRAVSQRARLVSDIKFAVTF